MHLLKSILKSSNDDDQIIDFSQFNLSELSPVSSPTSNRRHLAMDSTDIRKYLNIAPEIITRNIAYWFKNNIPGCTPIELKYFKLLNNLRKSISDQELALVFMSLLIHASKYELETFTSFVDDFDRGKFARPATADLPSQEVEEGALKILKKDTIIRVLTSQEYPELHTKLQMEKCKIVYIDFTTSYQIIKGWVTPIGVAINESGQEQLESTLPNNLESGLFFELKVFGAKFNYLTTSQPLLKIMEEKLRQEPLILPIISEDEKQNNPSVKTMQSYLFQS